MASILNSSVTANSTSKSLHAHGETADVVVDFIGGSAIARVNRVFRDKQGGLTVDYLGLADQLKQALATYTESGGQGSPIIDTAQAVAVLLEKYEVCCDLLHGFDWSNWMTGTSEKG